MSVPTYSTYEAKARFSEILRQVRAGESVLITYRGTEVAEIRPIAARESLEERLERLERSRVLASGVRKATQGRTLEPVAERPGALGRFLKSREGPGLGSEESGDSAEAAEASERTERGNPSP